MNNLNKAYKALESAAVDCHLKDDLMNVVHTIVLTVYNLDELTEVQQSIIVSYAKSKMIELLVLTPRIHGPQTIAKMVVADVICQIADENFGNQTEV